MSLTFVVPEGIWSDEGQGSLEFGFALRNWYNVVREEESQFPESQYKLQLSLTFL